MLMMACDLHRALISCVASENIYRLFSLWRVISTTLLTLSYREQAPSLPRGPVQSDFPVSSASFRDD